MEIQKRTTQDKAQRSFNGATVKLTEFGDFECPYCADAYRIIKQLEKEFGQQLSYEFKHFPLVQMHPHALMAAEAAEAAREQGKFEEMYDAFFEAQDRLSAGTIAKVARKIGLEFDRFTMDMAEHKYLPKIQNALNEGMAKGVQGTPSFFINDDFHADDWTFESLASAIRAQLGGELLF
jgi:protein-disulfide isomerase